MVFGLLSFPNGLVPLRFGDNPTYEDSCDSQKRSTDVQQIFFSEFPKVGPRCSRIGRHGLVAEKIMQVLGKLGDRLVTLLNVSVHRFSNDRVEVPLKLFGFVGPSYAWQDRIVVGDEFPNFMERSLKLRLVEWVLFGQNGIEQCTQRIDIASGIDGFVAIWELFRTHVAGGARRSPLVGDGSGENFYYGTCVIIVRVDRIVEACFGDSEIDYLDHRLLIDVGDHHVIWFDIPMDNSLLVGVLNG